MLWRIYLVVSKGHLVTLAGEKDYSSESGSWCKNIIVHWYVIYITTSLKRQFSCRKLQYLEGIIHRCLPLPSFGVAMSDFTLANPTLNHIKNQGKPSGMVLYPLFNSFLLHLLLLSFSP